MNISALHFSNTIGDYLTSIVGQCSIALTPRPRRVISIARGSSVAWDECCEGQLWGRLVNIQPMPNTNFARTPGLQPCSMPAFVGTFEIGILRCATAFNDNSGMAPSAHQITREGTQGVRDMAAILSILRCDEGVRGFTQWIPLGPEGGCFGGIIQFTALIPNCLECEDESDTCENQEMEREEKREELIGYV